MYIESYNYGTVQKIEPLPGINLYNVTILTEDTKEEITYILEYQPMGVGEEIEILNFEEHVIGIHNIKRKIKKRVRTDIKFPTEIIEQRLQKEYREHERYQMSHKLLSNDSFLTEVSDMYQYLMSEGGHIRGARDPNNANTFNSSKMFLDNARSIIFFYCVVKARNTIFDLYDSRISIGGISETLFNSVKKEYYTVFVNMVGKIPGDFQGTEEFDRYIEEVRDEVGL